jgi:hypothetical protein
MRAEFNFRLSFIILLSAIAAGASTAWALNLVIVTPLEMNFRTAPSADSAQVNGCPKLYSGMILKVYQEQGEWYYTEDMYGHKGWARAVYEGETYLKELPDNYLETQISAKIALDRAKPVALDWAEDAHPVLLSAHNTGWNGLSDEWRICFFAPSKRDPLPLPDKTQFREYLLKKGEEVTYPEFLRYLEVAVSSEKITTSEQIQESGGFPVDGPQYPIDEQELSKGWIDSTELFSPEKIVEYRSLPWDEESIRESIELQDGYEPGEFLSSWFSSANNTTLILRENSWYIISPGYFSPVIDVDAVGGSILKVEGY